jgi:hypothetical protein
MCSPAIPSFPPTNLDETNRPFEMLALALRGITASHGNDRRSFFPYGLVGLVLGLLMVSLLVILVGWKLSRRHSADPATTGREHSASTMSADTMSSLFPDRPIRPLPKRRLRERLSPEVADSIQYPPAPQTTTPLFYYAYSSRDDDPESPSHPSRDRAADARTHHVRRGGLGLESDDEEATLRRSAASRAISDTLTRSNRMSARQDQGKHANSRHPQSATSSADGSYDPFEVTNNKKKRKIPTAGDIPLNLSHGVTHSMHGPESPGTPIQSIEGHGELSSPVPSSYYASAGLVSSSHNISGPGRGRYGRVRNGRSPLRALSDSSSNWAGRNGKLRSSQWVSPSSK